MSLCPKDHPNSTTSPLEHRNVLHDTMMSRQLDGRRSYSAAIGVPSQIRDVR